MSRKVVLDKVSQFLIDAGCVAFNAAEFSDEELFFYALMEKGLKGLTKEFTDELFYTAKEIIQR